MRSRLGHEIVVLWKCTMVMSEQPKIHILPILEDRVAQIVSSAYSELDNYCAMNTAV